MKNISSEDGGHELNRNELSRGIGLPLPVQEANLFKHGATPHVLNFLSDNPEINLSIRQLAQLTPVSERATREAVDALAANDLVETVNDGNARRVHINRGRLTDTDDPVLAIPQTRFQTPVRVTQQYLEDELADLRGIILFGSVAQGDADRQSDIDLWVLVGDDHMEQRHAANKLAKRLGGLRIPSTIPAPDADTADFDTDWPEIRSLLEEESNEWNDAERYSFQILVETPQSIISQSDRVDAEQLFGRGITLYSTEVLERIKVEVLSDE